MRRRDFLIAGATLFGASLSACKFAAYKREEFDESQKQLNVFSWADYLHPATIPEFEKRTGIKVVYDTFASNEALLAKLQAGGSKYDIIVPTSYMVKQLIKMDKLAEIDHAKLTGLDRLISRFRDPSYDHHLKHSIPYTWGTTGIAFNYDAVADRLGSDFAKRAQAGDVTQDIFWEQKLGGRITLLDDARESIGMSLKRLGGSYNSLDTPQIEKATAELLVQKPLTMCYTSDQVITQLAAGDSWLALAFSGDAYQANRDNKSVRYVIPKSGTSIWVDNMCIPREAPHMEHAYAWLDFMLDPDVAAAIADHTRFASPNKIALSRISSELRDDPNLYPPESVLEKCEDLGDIGNAVFVYDRMWTELKCG